MTRHKSISLIFAMLAVLSTRETNAQALSEQCKAARTRAMMIPGMIDSSIGVPPALNGWRGSGERAPARDHGRTARFEARIDDKGIPIPSTIRVVGILDIGFERTLRRLLEKSRFFPAQIDGCDVEGLVELPFRIMDGGAMDAPRSPPRPEILRDSLGTFTLSVGSECAEVRARAKSQQLLDTEKLVPVRARNFVLPPMPAPSQVVGKPLTFTVRVDSSGAMIDNTATLTPFEPKSYHRKMLATIMTTKLRPAYVNRCAVESTYSVTMTIGPTTSR
jgi:hypothetical protein